MNLFKLHFVVEYNCNVKLFRQAKTQLASGGEILFAPGGKDLFKCAMTGKWAPGSKYSSLVGK